MILFCALCIQIQIFLCVHKSWGASLDSLEHSFAHILISFIHVARRIFGLVVSIDILWLLASIGIFWLLVSLFVMSLWHIFLLQSLGLNIVGLPPSITFGYVYGIPLSCWELHNFWRNTFYIGLLSFSLILAIDANGGEVSESFAEKFRELSPLALVLFLSICISFTCIICWCIT